MRSAAFGLLVFAFFSLGCERNNDNVVLLVDDESVSKSELGFWMLLSKAEVAAYYFREYGIQYSTDFWEEDYGNKTPLAMLKEKAIERLVWCKVQQMFARKLGVIKNIGFDELMAEMKVVNQKRKVSLANCEPIYGPIEFSPHTYFDHIFDKMVYDVKLLLLKDYLSIDTIDLLLSVKSGFHQMQFIDKKYDLLVLEMVNKVELTINKDVFDKVAID